MLLSVNILTAVQPYIGISSVLNILTGSWKNGVSQHSSVKGPRHSHLHLPPLPFSLKGRSETPHCFANEGGPWKEMGKSPGPPELSSRIKPHSDASPVYCGATRLFFCRMGLRMHPLPTRAPGRIHTSENTVGPWLA